MPKEEACFDILKKLFGKYLKIAEDIEWSSDNITQMEYSIKTTLNPTTSDKSRQFKTITGEKIIIDKEGANLLKVYVPYDKKGWIEVVKNVPNRKWDSEGRYWTIPNVKDSYRILKNNIGLSYLTFQFKISSAIPESSAPPKGILNKKRPLKKSFYEQLSNPQQEAIQQTVERLILERLSDSTQKTYKHHLAGLFYFYKNVSPK